MSSVKVVAPEQIGIEPIPVQPAPPSVTPKLDFSLVGVIDNLAKQAHLATRSIFRIMNKHAKDNPIVSRLMTLIVSDLSGNLRLLRDTCARAVALQDIDALINCIVKFAHVGVASEVALYTISQLFPDIIRADIDDLKAITTVLEQLHELRKGFIYQIICS